MSTTQQQIEHKLTSHFSPEYLLIVNESHMHQVPANSSTHFKVVLVCKQFEDLNRIARHKMLYALLNKEMAAGIHALALHLYTPDEWQNQSHLFPASPKCQGKNG